MSRWLVLVASAGEVINVLSRFDALLVLALVAKCDVRELDDETPSGHGWHVNHHGKHLGEIWRAEDVK